MSTPALGEKVSGLKPPNKKRHDSDEIDEGGGEEREESGDDGRSDHSAAEGHREEQEEVREDAARAAVISAFLRAGSASGGGATGPATAWNGDRYGIDKRRRRAQVALPLSMERRGQASPRGSSSAAQRPSITRDRREPTRAHGSDEGPPSQRVQRSNPSVVSGEQEDGEGSDGKGVEEDDEQSVAVDIEGLAEDLRAREGETVLRIEALRSQVGLDMVVSR